ncbi:MAG: urea ABC transporter permease subunit UrtB [Betaproteobacteria bacterium]|nr:MAG: urea ABC transporter permease subunit UrtB [Betaproteobacteria bacterium]
MRRLLVLLCLLAAGRAWALDPAAVGRLAFGDGDERIAAIGALLASGEPRVTEVLQAFAAGELQTAGERVLIVRGEEGFDAASGQRVAPLPPEREDVVANNRLRSAAQAALASLKLLAPERAARLEAARALSGSVDPATAPLLRKALEVEGDGEIRALLAMAVASLDLASDDRATRLAAIRMLGESSNAAVQPLLAAAVKDPDAEIRSAAKLSLIEVEGRLKWGEILGLLFAGVSLGSILMLAALGLAITYGLMGVINMAHGELIMIGAYTAYVVQNAFRSMGLFEWYLLAAVPASFAVAALVGMLLERSVIRWLYGRPLETLLATWGISLVLIQGVRTLFGAQNVPVENPAWVSGGIAVMSNLTLPWNRIAIIVFAAAVLAAIGLLLARTRLGLFVRGVTQNREMASCVGVPTARVDTLAFGLGAGLAGLAGCALSQIGNVGPDLGQGYIVDSFLVVVFGGVGQLGGTVYAALMLGFANKFLEAWSGAVIAKIVVLVFIVFFIQSRPQGLFALKGRAA